MILEFVDGDIVLGDVFEKFNYIEVLVDVVVIVIFKEIMCYGIKCVVKFKVVRNK